MWFSSLTHSRFGNTLRHRLRWQPEVLSAIETTLGIVTIEGVTAQAQIGVAVMAFKAIAMQHQTLHGGLLHKINSLLAEPALLRGGLLLKGERHLRTLRI